MPWTAPESDRERVVISRTTIRDNDMAITPGTLARMASDIAAGLVAPGYNKEYSQYDLPAKDVAERAVSIAYAIAGAVEAIERKRRDRETP